MRIINLYHLCMVLLIGAVLAGSAREAQASRDAAFMSPGSGTARQGKSEEAVVVEPKSDIELGETSINMGRRATFFFVNTTGSVVDIENVTANGDSNVHAEIVADDCSKEGKISASSRCSVTIEVTPSGSGSWTTELLMTHKAAGRIARARVRGKTTGASQEKHDAGLSLNTKDFKAVDFGEVELDSGKAVRTALMVNDSAEVITILSVEIIAPENGLERIEQGCAPDMDLKAGESCPITIIWRPETRANVSTDLIIRHSGRLGFAVIPIRGTAKENTTKDGGGKDSNSRSSLSVPTSGSNKIPMSPTADELEKMIQNGKMPQISADALPSGNMRGEPRLPKADATSALDDIHLIGTVGNRAVIYKPDGTTAIVAIGEELSVDGGATIKILNVGAKDADVFYAGKKRNLKLEVVSALTEKASRARAASSARGGVKRENNSNGGNKMPVPTEPSIVSLPAVKP